MSVEYTVHTPGRTHPVDLDTYANIVAAISGYGTYEQAMSLPSYFQLDNPKTGTKVTVASPDWHHDQEK